MRPAVLGLSCFYHDSAAALVIDSELVAAAQQERFSRVKHDCLFPVDAARFCLAQGGLRLSDLDAVVFYEEPEQKLFRILQTIGQKHPNRRDFLARILPEWLQHPGLVRERLVDGLMRIDAGFDAAKLHYTTHHRSHAASAFYPSPFDPAAVLTIDGVGEFATTSIHAGNGSKLELLRQIEFPHSIGLLYAAFTAYLGFKINDGEYKVMGLAPYGEPRFADRIKTSLFALHDDGSFIVNQDFFDFFTADRMYNNRLTDLLGQPPRVGKDMPLTQFHMDIAASIQVVATEAMLGLARAAVRETGHRDLCLAGGVALNCVANGRLLRSGIVDRLWIQPAAGDAGGAIGAAFIGAHEVLKPPQSRPRSSTRLLAKLKRRWTRERSTADRMGGAYLGPEFSQGDIEAYLSSIGATFEVFADDNHLIQATVEHLTACRVVGWYQGRMEFGPRALGNRSILADPRSPSMQRTLNAKIKNRESFRPFAPATTAEAYREWFALESPSPYMLLTGDVRERHRLPVACEPDGLSKLDHPRSTVPAVTHVDYSARVQTVDAATNPLFHRLLTAFATVSGVPILVNTSFNVSDEPIVCTPEDAYRCFLAAQIDVLVIGRCMLRHECQQVTLPHRLDVPATGAFEIENRWCVQWYADGRMHVLETRFYPLLAGANLNQSIPTTEYKHAEEWWSALRSACRGRFVIVACGGSTTAFNINWPYFLADELRSAGFSRPVVTINLGQPLYSSFDLFFLLERFLPEARERGIRIDQILSLHGANDVGYRLQVLIQSLRNGDSDAFSPNETRLLGLLGRHRIYPSVDMGPYREVLLTRSDKFAALTRILPPQPLTDDIIDCFAATLGAVRDLCRSHAIPSVDFLQPMLLERWSHRRVAWLKETFKGEVDELIRASTGNGTPIGQEQAFDTVRRRHNVRLHIGEGPAIQDDPRTRGPYMFDWATIYDRCSKLWSALAARERGDFFDLNRLFAEETEDVFMLDGVHYTLAGSRKVAAAIAAGFMQAQNRSATDKAVAAIPQPRAASPGSSEAAGGADAVDRILARCSIEAEHDAVPAFRAGWNVLDGRPPLDPSDARRWDRLAAELRKMAASIGRPAPSYKWETEAGELYPMY